MTAQARDLLTTIRLDGWTAEVKRRYESLKEDERAALKEAMELPLFVFA